MKAVPVPPMQSAALYAIFRDWIRIEHDGARRRSGASFRAAADMRDLWLWLARE